MSRIDEIKDRQKSRGFKGLAEQEKHWDDDIEYLLSEVDKLKSEYNKIWDALRDSEDRYLKCDDKRETAVRMLKQSEKRVQHLERINQDMIEKIEEMEF